MLEGEIIKFYRNKAGLTQEQLGKGICSSKHVGKIERGQTSYSPELILLFSERLNIDIEKEIANFKNIEKKLHNWHNSIVKQGMLEVEKTKKELEKYHFIESSKYASFYLLLQARYYILQKDFEKTYTILQHIQRDYPDLPPYEKNLQWHVWGIFYGNTQNQQKSINILKEIDENVYGNLEYYHHLALAYYCVNSKSMAYAFAEKALRHFKETNNFLRAIDAEAVTLLLKGSDMHFDFQEIIESYHNLIHDSERLNAPERKVMLQNNLGDLYLKRKDYANAQKFSKETLDMVDKSSFSYLMYLYNYLESSLEGKLLRKTVMLKKAREGLSVAKKLDNRLYQTLFNLLINRIENKLDQYYSFIEDFALPYFQSNKHTMMINRYAKELYHHYMEIEHFEKAARISKNLINSEP